MRNEHVLIRISAIVVPKENRKTGNEFRSEVSPSDLSNFFLHNLKWLYIFACFHYVTTTGSLFFLSYPVSFFKCFFGS
jgi:hypothetical protein